MARDEVLGAQRFQHDQWRDPYSRQTTPSSPTNEDEKVEQIHSGHFMISNPHRIKKHGFDFEDAAKCPSTSYRFGKGDHESFEIDGSFAKLFQCLSLAYSGAAIISPKWKSFKGMKLSWKDKIRLNNAIWREWHCQFKFGHKPVLCHFTFPISDSIHSTPQAIVLEGKYWKRTLGTVVKEYMKWRTFYRKKRASSFSSDGMKESASSPLQDQILQEILGGANRSPEPVPMVLDEEALLSEFTDTLFTSLDQKFLFPNPRELSHMSTNADVMQPGLVQLQPSIDELMDTFEPLQDVMKSVAQSMHCSTPSTFVFTGNNSFRPSLIQPGQLSGSGSSSSALPETVVAASAGTIPQPTMMDTMALDSTVDSIGVEPVQVLSQHQNQQALAIDLQQQFNTQQQLTSNQQQLDNQQFIISQPDLQQQQQDLSTQLAATQQKLQEVSRQMSATQQQLGHQQFGTSQLQQQQQQIQLLQQQQQQQQLLLQQQTQQNPLQSFGITTLGGGMTQEATLHTPSTGDTTRILLNNADLTNLQTQLQNSSNGILSQPVQGITAQQVLNPMGSVQVRIAPGEDVKVGTPIHQLAVSNTSQQNQVHVQQQQQRTLQQQSQQGVTMSHNAAGGSLSAGASQQQQVAQFQGLQTILSAGGNQTQAIKLLQQVANQVTQNNQPVQQQQNMAVQQTNNKALISQLFDQNIVPSGNTASFVSVQSIQQQQHQQHQQQPIPIQLTKAAPPNDLAKTHMTQSVTRNQLVNSVAKVPSPTKATPGSYNNIPMGAKAKTKRQPKAKQPPKIAPAPPSTSANAITATSSAALLTQLLTQGIRATGTSQPMKPATTTIGGGALLIQPVKSEFASTSTLPTVLSVTSSLPGGVPFLGVAQTQPSLFTVATSSTNTTNVFTSSLLGRSSILSTPPKSEDKSRDPLFTIGVVSSPPGTSSGGESADTPMDQTQVHVVVETLAQTPTGKKDTHISAEQKRRVNIKSGFDMLQSLVPSLRQNPNAKISKAQMLQKAVEYTKKLQVERGHINEEVDILKQEVAALNVAISETQSQLPASGVPVTRQRFDMMKDIFDDYVRDRTAHNWKFWIFSIIIRPLFESYNASVSTQSTEELFRTVLAWLDQHCSLLALRPTVLSSLTLLSRTTSILSDPGQVPQQAAEAVTKRNDEEQKK